MSQSRRQEQPGDGAGSAGSRIPQPESSEQYWSLLAGLLQRVEALEAQVRLLEQIRQVGQAQGTGDPALLAEVRAVRRRLEVHETQVHRGNGG